MNLFQRLTNNNNTKQPTKQDIQKAPAIKLNKAPTEQYNLLQQQVNAFSSNELTRLRELVEDVITRPDSMQDIKSSITKSANTQLFSDDSTRPPKPELTSDIKRLWWMLSKIQNRLNWRRISSHINQQYYKTYKQEFVTYNTLRNFGTTRNAKWSNETNEWTKYIAFHKCRKALPFAYELLTSAEQYKYDEMFGKPKVIK